MPDSPLEPSLTSRDSQPEADLAVAMVHGSADALMALDRDFRITFWNAASEQLFGWRAEEVLGRRPQLLIPPTHRHELDRALHVLSGGQEEAALETERLHRNGEVLPVTCRLSPMRDRSGTLIGACAVMRDNSREIELRRQLESTRALAEARFAQSVVAQVTLSPDGTVLEANPALLRLTGNQERDLLGQPMTRLLHEADADRAATGLSRLVSGAPPEMRRPRLLRHAAGHFLETRMSTFVVRDDDGTVQRLEVVVEDVSAEAAAGREVELREARWRSLASHSSDVALFCDAQATLLFATESALSVFGYRAQDLVQDDGWSYVHPDDVEAIRAQWYATAAAPAGTSMKVELRVRHADGTWRWVEGTMTQQLDDPAVHAMVVNLVDVSERRSAEAVLHELAGTDTLTGLATRAPLMGSLDAAFAAGRAEATAVAVLDITRMKLVNDTYGHQTGDEVLVEVAARLVRTVGSSGVVARIGGDSFAVLHTEMGDIADMFGTCAALIEAVAEPIQLDGHRLMISATVGAAVGPAVDSGALLASAESALAVAREGLTGPMHVVRAESASSALCHARLIEDLRRGLEHGELVVHYQPVISLSDGRPVAAEALVRWLHPDKGLLSPAAFIPAAEESGLILEVGAFVLGEACRAAARWAGIEGRSGFHVAVNLSAKQLTRGSVVDVVRQALADSGASPQNLMLEVTESAVMSDISAAVRVLQELRALGVAIAVDDFGTGYSSLTYLKQFPVTTLKIDRSFVSGLGTNRDDAAIVTSVINLARAMGLECIAEGVETEQQRLVLQALGCTLGQGFLWSPGLDAATFETWLGAAGAPAPARQPARPTGQPRRAARQPISPAVHKRVEDLDAAGASLATIAAALNADQQLTPEGKRWTARSVARLLAGRAQR